ncbi:hypothetical protein I312_100414 [Cryptococcus bacillisporus CA1280]|uniref:uncharacterized protein n=1 Tax=Cryptococcus bacillisporus CA1280 TaxID=1296109 RepID=UPI003366A0B3
MYPGPFLGDRRLTNSTSHLNVLCPEHFCLLAHGNYPDDHVCECSSCKCLVITKNKFCVNCRKGNHA